MKENITLPNIVRGEGKVKLEYIKDDNSKVVVCEKNHVFNVPWNFSHALDLYLFNSDRPRLLLTDYDGPVNTSLALLPGNFVGYAYNNSPASGLYQGHHASSEFTSQEGRLVSTKVYEWTASQIPGEIHTIGYTMQTTPLDYINIPAYVLPYIVAPKCFKYRGRFLTNPHCKDLYHDVVVYQTSSVTVNSSSIRFLFYYGDDAKKDTTQSKSITYTFDSPYNYAGSIGSLMCIDADTGSIKVIVEYIRRTSSSSPYEHVRDIFKFNPATDTMSLEDEIPLFEDTSTHWTSTYYITTYQSNYMSSRATGVIKGDYCCVSTGYMTVPNAHVVMFDYTEPETQATMRRIVCDKFGPVNYGGAGNSMYITDIVDPNTVLMQIGDYNTRDCVLIDLRTFTNLGIITSCVNSGSYYRSPEVHYVNGVLLPLAKLVYRYEEDYFSVGSSGNMLAYDGALTWFRVPDSAPARPANSAVRITYELSFEL